MSSLTFKRILLKYSGEAVAGSKEQGIDPSVLHFMSNEIKSIVNKKVAVGLVIGGGNLFRGKELNQDGIDRVAGDHMGMLATVMNGIALRDSLERLGVKTRVMSAIPMPGIVEHYDRRLAIQLLDAGFVVIFTAGTGNPFFTTDTAACLRAIEVGADLMLKATKVDGVYSDDPKINPEASFYRDLTFNEAISKNLKVMDTTALTLARDNEMKIKVFNFRKEGALLDIVDGGEEGTIITNG
ncbi:MAG: UMP kinase [SAR86 cluster bacterium]|uniref:Uridylate kinase n=1 Tax=SAR86 cluster bacterium TaxID=2030880 RepID=A0A368BMI9_9GAMM|nr:MAG: UMP kinase [Gammaproteobacteria bacterium TMED219]RCL37916.1 MAG: UMP kinase [SAR86 cluster bacterium]